MLIEESHGDGRYGGRAAHQAPEVDGATEVRAGPGLGQLRGATWSGRVVTGAEGADLLADAVDLISPARGADPGESA